MKQPSSNWSREINTVRDSVWVGDAGPDLPAFPWLSHTVHPKIRSVIMRWGVERRLKTGEAIFSEDEVVDRIALVTSGVTARCAGAPFAQTRSSAAFSTPGRFACGNLNFFTSRSCIGRYFALMPSTVMICSQSLLRSLALKDVSFFSLLASQFEMCNLSDRLGFIADSQLAVEQRIACFYLTWSVYYGRLSRDAEGQSWVNMPTPLRGEALRWVIGCSISAFEKHRRFLRQSDFYQEDGDRIQLRVSYLDPIHAWLHGIEECHGTFAHRPDSLLDLYRHAFGLKRMAKVSA